MRRHLLPILFVALSCSQRPVPDVPPWPGTPGGPEVIELTADGLKPAPQAPVTKSTLQQALPGYEIAGEEGAERFAVRYAGNTMVVVDLDGQGGYRVKVRDPSVLVPTGARVDGPFSTIADEPDLQCRRSMGTQAEVVNCTTPSLPRITFVVKLPVAQTPDCPADCELGPQLLGATTIYSVDFQ